MGSLKKVCAFCGKRIIGGNRRQLYDTDYCKQAAARSRRNERKKSLNQWEMQALAQIYDMLTLPDAEIEGMVLMLVGCHKRDQWAHKMSQLAYLLTHVRPVEVGWSDSDS